MGTLFLSQRKPESRLPASPPSNLLVVRRQEQQQQQLLCRCIPAGEGCVESWSGKRAACWAQGQGERTCCCRAYSPTVVEVVPAAALLTAACYSRAQPEAKRGPAGGIKGCSAGLPQTPVCSMRWTRSRALTAPTRVHTCAPSAPPLPDRWLKASQFWKPVLSGNSRRPGVESADDCVSIPREPCKEENLVYNRGKKYTWHASQFKRGKVFASPEMGLFPSCLN